MGKTFRHSDFFVSDSKRNWFFFNSEEIQQTFNYFYSHEHLYQKDCLNSLPPQEFFFLAVLRRNVF